MITMNETIRLTGLSHGGGCGCKIAPALLGRLLASTALPFKPPPLLVGTETSDDAAVWRLNDHQAIVATTDFFMPIVDDPYDFGRIAATNALSDVYAMGGTPLFALALVGMPLDKLPEAAIQRILQGGEDVCRAAGIPIAGGHSIDSVEPIYGLVGIGLVHPAEVKTNRGARTGDRLILGKPLGIGVLSAALKKGELSAAGYAEMLRWTTRLNVTGARLAGFPGVHAMTDVTGFGLGGHLLEICRASGLAARVSLARLPVIDEARTLIARGIATGASQRNWQSYGARIDADDAVPTGLTLAQTLITDPQTSGGLLIACAAEDAPVVLDALRQDGFDCAAEIGELVAGEPTVTLDP